MADEHEPDKPSLSAADAAMRFGIPLAAIEEQLGAGRLEGFRDDAGAWHVHLDDQGRLAVPDMSDRLRSMRSDMAHQPAEIEEAPGTYHGVADEVTRPGPLAFLGIFVVIYGNLRDQYGVVFSAIVRVFVVALAAALIARFLYREPGQPDEALAFDWVLLMVCVGPLAVWEVVTPVDPRYDDEDRSETIILAYATFLAIVSIPVAMAIRMGLSALLD